MSSKPTLDFYGYLASAFDFFNKNLFDNELSQVMFTITRKKNVAGYFRKGGWLNEEEDSFHEIAVNPSSFITASPLELCQTIVHEMCHQWQEEHGTPSRTSYHNTEWADKMRDIGLEPLSKNGKGTGQSVSDRPISGDRFEQACIEFFVLGYKLAVIDKEHHTGKSLKMLNKIIAERISATANESDDSEIISKGLSDSMIVSALSTPITEFYEVEVPEGNKQVYSKKTTYQCGKCLVKVWGAPTLNIACLTCETKMAIVS